MPTRTFTRDQLAAIGVPNLRDAEPEHRAEHLHDEQIDTRRWVSVHHLVFRIPGSDVPWRVEYVRGLTESQDGISPWEYAGDVIEATEVELVSTTVKEWHAVPESGPRTVPQLADIPPAAFGVSSEEAAANVTAAVPVLAASGLPAAEEPCTDPRHTGPIRAQLGCNGPDPAEADEEGQEQPLAVVGSYVRAGLAKGLAPAEEQPTAPALDPFTEAAIRRSALLSGADAIEALPQDHECDPGRGDAVKLLRRLALHTTVAEQPTGLTWEARAEHAVRLYATTAIELEDARRENTQLRAERDELIEQRDRITHDTMAALGLAEVEQGQADADALAAEFPDTIASLVEEIADDIPHRRAPQIAANYLNRHARLLADQITTLGQARGWSTWAAEYIHPDREFIDPNAGDDQAEEQPHVPAVGDRYVSRNVARTVTVSRVWKADAGYTAVAYQWHDDRPGQCGSACPVDVFHREYEAVEEQPLAFPQLAVPCPRCKAPAGQLCTSHSGTRQRTSDTHQDRTRAYRRATQAGR
ncbi:hypothetical protein [Streptomyces sp. NPDC096095]|uniref:zinc finger domain-containing protein n=1 Tax=Streptomyces sp. NPDC096095 TaxID=3155545 RepID=UPI00332A0650